MIDYNVGRISDDLEYDSLTGELTPLAGGGLKPRDEDAPTLSELRAQAEGKFCEYVLDQNGDIEDYKVASLLLDTLTVVNRQGPFPSDELVAAVSDVSARVRSLLPEEPPFLDEGHSAWSDEFDAIFEPMFEELHPGLVNERNALRQERMLRYRQVYEDAAVLDAQRLIVAKCDIHVPQGYEFKTPEELGVSDRFRD